jgi:hypothetical protein
VETILASEQSHSQLFSQDFFAGIVWQLQVVDAGHDGRQVVVWVNVAAVESLLDNGQVRAQSFEAANRQTRAASHKLQKLSLLFARVAGHHFLMLRDSGV